MKINLLYYSFLFVGSVEVLKAKRAVQLKEGEDKLFYRLSRFSPRSCVYRNDNNSFS